MQCQWGHISVDLLSTRIASQWICKWVPKWSQESTQISSITIDNSSVSQLPYSYLFNNAMMMYSWCHSCTFIWDQTRILTIYLLSEWLWMFYNQNVSNQCFCYSMWNSIFFRYYHFFYFHFLRFLIVKEIANLINNIHFCIFRLNCKRRNNITHFH